MSTSDIQNRWQADGPCRPDVSQFLELLAYIPAHFEISAIAIRGQGGGVVVETFHDGQKFVYAFVEECGQLVPTTEERLATPCE
jgi:hypothetical protein